MGIAQRTELFFFVTQCNRATIPYRREGSGERYFFCIVELAKVLLMIAILLALLFEKIYRSSSLKLQRWLTNYVPFCRKSFALQLLSEK